MQFQEEKNLDFLNFTIFFLPRLFQIFWPTVNSKTQKQSKTNICTIFNFRHCCHNNGVPRDCLDWCRGLQAKGQSETCALSHAKTIANCFHEGHISLPGPPINIRVTPTSATSAIAKWVLMP